MSISKKLFSFLPIEEDQEMSNTKFILQICKFNWLAFKNKKEKSNKKKYLKAIIRLQVMKKSSRRL